MKLYNFHNETFEVELEFLVLKNDKNTKKVVNHLQKRGFDLSDSKELVNHAAFCTEVLSGGVILIFINLDMFTTCKGGKIESIMYLQHECNHFRQRTLESIHETVDKTDLEAHLRISDWAFKKCMSTKFFKSLLK